MNTDRARRESPPPAACPQVLLEVERAQGAPVLLRRDPSLVFGGSPDLDWFRARSSTLRAARSGLEKFAPQPVSNPLEGVWETAGLVRPSIARLDRIAEISANHLGSAGRIGRLADADIGDITVIKAVPTEITR